MKKGFKWKTEGERQRLAAKDGRGYTILTFHNQQDAYVVATECAGITFRKDFTYLMVLRGTREDEVFWQVIKRDTDGEQGN